MKIRLPSSPHKRYLTGMDWIIHALDHASRKRLGAGNAFQIVVELSGGREDNELEASFRRYCLCFPPLWGRVSRDFNLAPYWKPGASGGNGIGFSKTEASTVEETWKLLEDEINRPFGMREPSVKVLEIRLPGKAFVGFSFDHRLFDARGAELFLKNFQAFFLSEEKDGEIKTAAAPAYLDRWDEQFEAGKKVNRARLAEDKLSKVRFLTARNAPQKRLNRFKIKTFSEAETAAVFERSDTLAGPFMFFLYGLAVSMRAMHALFQERGGSAGDIVVSVTRDMRSPAERANPAVLFNHLSFLFFRAGAEELDDLKALLASLKCQFYEHVKNKTAETLSEASMLMRILPKAVLSRGLQPEENASFASFSFASTGESSYHSEHLLEEKIENMIHVPRVPPSPGLGIYFSQYGNKLNLTLSYLDYLLNEQEAEGLISEAGKL